MTRNSIAVADYHVHPDYSYDAVGSIDEYCQAALARGLNEICFTTHYDSNGVVPSEDVMIRVNGKMVPNNAEQLKKYLDACRVAHQKFYMMGLAVHGGIEVGYYPGCEEEIRKLFNQCQFHYKLGAVHEVDRYCICYDKPMKECARDMDLETFADRYFALLTAMVQSRLFDAVAHLDLYRLHGLKYFGEGVLKIHEGRVEPLLELMRDLEVGFEINTKAVRKGLPEYYPTMTIVNQARKVGARIMSIGSDAHRPDEVASDFEMASALAYDLYPYIDE